MIDGRILHIDNHLIIVNKLPGELTQGDRTGDRTLADDIKAYLKERFGKPGNVYLGIVHRLDRPTSGAVVYARTEKALSRMEALFQKSLVRKTYWAAVDRRPAEDSGLMVDHLYHDAASNKSRVVPEGTPGAKEARLSYVWLCSSERYHLLQIELLTGRHHQIRAQLAARGIHIKGDLKYGARRSDPGGGIHLHARSVEFEHPVSHQMVSVVAPPPADPVWDALAAMLEEGHRGA